MFNSQIAQFDEANKNVLNIKSKLSASFETIRKYKDADGLKFSSAPLIEGFPYTFCEAILFGIKAAESFSAIKINKTKPVPPSRCTPVLNKVPELEAAAQEVIRLINLLKANPDPLVLTSGRYLDKKGASIEVKQAIEAAPVAEGSQEDAAAIQPSPPAASHLIDFGEAAKVLVQKSDELICSVTNLASVTGLNVRNSTEIQFIADDSKSTEEALQSAQTAATSATAASLKIEEVAKQAQALKANAEAAVSSAQAQLAKQSATLTTALDKITAATTSSANDSAAISAKLDEVVRVSAQAETAHTSLTAYSATLEATDTRVKGVEARAQKVTTDFETKRTSIDALIVQANKMVSGATVAGLAQAFSEEKKSLERSMAFAYGGFIAGIILLILATSVLVAYLIKVPIFENISGKLPVLSSHYDVTLGGIISRAVILLAPTWLTLFSARRYRSLFDLRQQYSHKYNMAFSLEGFKTQAPDHAQDIVAWVFKIVSAEPVSQKPGTSMDETPPTLAEMMNGVWTGLGKALIPTPKE